MKCCLLPIIHCTLLKIHFQSIRILNEISRLNAVESNGSIMEKKHSSVQSRVQNSCEVGG